MLQTSTGTKSWQGPEEMTASMVSGQNRKTKKQNKKKKKPKEQKQTPGVFTGGALMLMVFNKVYSSLITTGLISSK